MTATELIESGASLDHLYTGCLWSEGAVWLPETRAVRWSDIPNTRIMEYDSVTGETHIHRSDVEYTNGRTLDLDGRVLQCSHGRRSIEREVDGVPTTLADHWEGHRLNSPNDIVVSSDGVIWFTDPEYGILPRGYEGHPGEMEYGGRYVFRFDETDGSLTPVITDMIRPNGLAFSPDESILYVSDTSGTSVPDGVSDSSGTSVPDGVSHILAFDMVDGLPVNRRVFAVPDPGLPDGFRVDVEGRIWTSDSTGVLVYAPDGELLERIAVPEKVANVCFGGEDGRDLYIAASTSLYRIRTTTTQAARPQR